MEGLIAIVGGGITGLAAAWELERRKIPYLLLEASSRLGGKLRSEVHDGFLIEAGPDSFVTQRPWALELAREVGIETELIPPQPPGRTYLLRHGRLLPFPKGLRLLVPLDEEAFWASELMSEEGKRRLLQEPEVPPGSGQDESLASFIRRRFGEEALEALGAPLLAGLYLGDPEELSLKASYPQYLELEQRFGSVIRGVRATPAGQGPGFLTPRGGVERLAQAVGARLHSVRTQARVVQVTPEGLRLEGGAWIASRAVLLTPLAQEAARLLPEALARPLREFKAESSAVVSLAYRREAVSHPLDGTGFVSADRRFHLRASTWHSSKFADRAPGGFVLLRAFFGGHPRPEDALLPEAELVQLAQHELGELLGLQGPPLFARVVRWIEASPQYRVGHHERLAQLRAQLPPWLELAGASYEGVGIPDCIRQGRQAALRLAERFYAL
jgi:oxygen-dependent protoporphyrinogen oxidase